ncbi:molybdenum ABC transporter, periplasmic molybdate-binding protein [Cyanobacterium stanieri PCC 7202]|uniref:Molybdenum ABC transporter, periplasmic molybdate-binding protein n=1 Tax=Cyanobacterium stanieri (strain ATCC 29140 / PCC 7202) TaxID=292563 RepID=K9YP87_CYASC|nr:molybdenum ABC transporter, periplasmic molybdate-binding protein [Cyanobacterium stanieri PCC 7202]
MILINQIIKYSLHFLASILLLISCTPQNNSSPTILVGAAASLESVLTEIDQLYPDNIEYTFASSGILQQQIEQGANIDLFISASSRQMDALEEKNLLMPQTRTNLLTNQIVLITAIDNPITISDFNQLNTDNVNLISMGEPNSVPAGQYGKEILDNLNLFESLQSQSKLLFANNVRATLTHVETGNADVGIVYLTDAQSSNQVRIIATGDSHLHSPIIYPVAITQNSQNLAQAQKYLEFLKTEEIENIFTRYGFGVNNG